jgi:hypothetical protein
MPVASTDVTVLGDAATGKADGDTLAAAEAQTTSDRSAQSLAEDEVCCYLATVQPRLWFGVPPTGPVGCVNDPKNIKWATSAPTPAPLPAPRSWFELHTPR